MFLRYKKDIAFRITNPEWAVKLHSALQNFFYTNRV